MASRIGKVIHSRSYEYPLEPRPAVPFSDPEGVDGNIHTNWLESNRTYIKRVCRVSRLGLPCACLVCLVLLFVLGVVCSRVV